MLITGLFKRTAARSVMDFLQVAHAAASSLKLILNPDTTRAYSTTGAGRSFLRSVSFQGFPLQVALKLSDLGVNSTAAHKQLQSNYWGASTQQNQNCGVCELCLGHIITRKAEVFLKVIHPAVSFGCEFVSAAPSACSGLRGKYSSAVWGLASARNHFLAPILALEKQ